MLYSCLLLFTLFVSSFCDNSPLVAIVDTANPGIDDCETQHFEGSLTISSDDSNDRIGSCIRGIMEPGDYFNVRFYNSNGEELTELSYREDFEGTESKLPTLTQPMYIEDIATLVEFSNDALSSVITVNLFYKDETEVMSTFELHVTPPTQSIGSESNNGIVFLSSKPRKSNHCSSNSDDIYDTISNGETFYVCAVYYNLICPDTVLSLSVSGSDSNGLLANLGDLNEIYLCDGNDDSFVNKQYRYIEVSNYDSLSEVEAIASMQSNNGEILAQSAGLDINNAQPLLL